MPTGMRAMEGSGVMSRKKKILIALGAVAVWAVCVGACYLYQIYHPNLMIGRTWPISEYEDGIFHRETITLDLPGEEAFPMAKRVERELDMLWSWNGSVIHELTENYAQHSPYYIRVSGENDGGRITLRYQGIVTDAQGKSVDYERHAVFDLSVPDEDFKLS